MAVKKIPLSSPIQPHEAAEFARLVEAWARDQHERNRLSYGWQRASARRWERLAQLAGIASFPAPPKEVRRQARRVARECRDPKIKGVMRAGYHTLAWVLFRASRWPAVS